MPCRRLPRRPAPTGSLSGLVRAGSFKPSGILPEAGSNGGGIAAAHGMMGSGGGGKQEPRSPVKERLPPPLPFVRGIDEAALQAHREGNLLYRMGSAFGSKGELRNLPEASRSHSSVIDLPPRQVTPPPRDDSESPF